MLSTDLFTISNPANRNNNMGRSEVTKPDPPRSGSWSCSAAIYRNCETLRLSILTKLQTTRKTTSSTIKHNQTSSLTVYPICNSTPTKGNDLKQLHQFFIPALAPPTPRTTQIAQVGAAMWRLRWKSWRLHFHHGKSTNTPPKLHMPPPPWEIRPSDQRLFSPLVTLGGWLPGWFAMNYIVLLTKTWSFPEVVSWWFTTV